MEARLIRAAILVATICCLGASHRTRNFMATAATPDLARQVCEEAERFRKELAIQWLGKELPPWPAPCPIRVKTAPRMGAGGATSFSFNGRYPMHWQMEVFGTQERVLDSVLPHEVMHTVFATHFGQPLPRWADEGACTTVEHEAERAKHKQLLIRFLKTGKGIPFNRMFAMKQYPPEMLPLYAQGYSVARYLIAQGGRRKFVDFVGEGLSTERWDAAIRNHYGFKDLSELQLTWVDWVADGSPPVREGQALEQIAAREQDAPKALQSPDGRGVAARQTASNNRLQEVPPRDVGGVAPAKSRTPVELVGHRSEDRDSAASSSGGGWYARQRDLARQRQTGTTDPVSRGLKPSVGQAVQDDRRTQPAGKQGLMEWRKGQPLPAELPSMSRRPGTVLR